MMSVEKNNSIKPYINSVQLPESLIQKIQAYKYDGLGINNNNSLENGLMQNYKISGINSYSTHDGEYMAFGAGVDPEKLGLTKDNGWNITTDKYGNNIAYRQKGWMERNGSALFNGLNAAVGLGQLGLGIAQYGMAKKYYNAQTDVLKEKLKESKEEYARLKNLRKSIAAKYSK
jgi:hypothetical protein